MIEKYVCSERDLCAILTNISLQQRNYYGKIRKKSVVNRNPKKYTFSDFIEKFLKYRKRQGLSYYMKTEAGTRF